MRIVYCDCFSGISGDMFLSAMLDAGLPIEQLRNSLNQLLPEKDYEIDWDKVKKGAIEAGHLIIRIKNPELMSHHRHYTDIVSMVEESGLNHNVKARSKQIFRVLAQAEAKVHGTTLDSVHFHEVGAIDSIIDIVGAAVALDYFQVEKIYSSPLPLGNGEVQTDHGKLPVPAPATAELMRIGNARVVPSEARVELVTPTGAAILAAFATFEQPEMNFGYVGTGSGEKDLPWPNIMRVFIGDLANDVEQQKVLIETNIDDMNSQVLGYLMKKLFDQGALDVYFTPIYMKKNRPATQVSVIARREDEEKFYRLFVTETSTLGIRIQPVYRYETDREIVEVKTKYGTVPIKVKSIDGVILQGNPEYEFCAKIAEKEDVPLLDVIEEAKREFYIQNRQTE